METPFNQNIVSKEKREHRGKTSIVGSHSRANKTFDLPAHRYTTANREAQGVRDASQAQVTPRTGSLIGCYSGRIKTNSGCLCGLKHPPRK